MRYLCPKNRIFENFERILSVPFLYLYIIKLCNQKYQNLYQHKKIREQPQISYIRLNFQHLFSLRVNHAGLSHYLWIALVAKGQLNAINMAQVQAVGYCELSDRKPNNTLNETTSTGQMVYCCCYTQFSSETIIDECLVPT